MMPLMMIKCTRLLLERTTHAECGPGVFQMPCDPTPVGLVGACDVMYNDALM